MALSIVHVASFASGTSTQTTWTSAPFNAAVDDWVVVVVGNESAAHPSGIADSLANSYTLRESGVRAAAQAVSMWAFRYAAAQTGITLTVTWSPATDTRLVKVGKVSGAAASPFPDTASAGGTGGVARISGNSASVSPAPGSMTPSNADLIVAVAGWQDDVAVTTPPSGYTILGADQIEAVREDTLSTYYKIQGATGAENPTWTLPSSENWVACQLAFKEAPAAVLPVNTVAPAVTGNTWVGQVLTDTDGTWTGTPTPTITKQWQREVSVGSGTYADIAGATADTHTNVDADRTLRKRIKEHGSNASGEVDAFSAAVGPIGTATALLGLLEMQADLVGSWLAPPPEIQGGQRPHIGIGIRIGV